MKKFLLAAIFLLGCGPIPVVNNRWDPPRTIHVDIVINKYHDYDCRKIGGTWIAAYDSSYINVFVGCIEPVKKDK